MLNQGTVLLFPSPCFRIEEVLVSLLTFAGVGKTVSIGVNYSQSRRMGYNDNRQDTPKIQSSS